MRIAIIGHKAIPSRRGGVEIHVEEIAARLAARGHEVTVYNRRIQEEQIVDAYRGIHVKHVPCINAKGLEALTASAIAACDALFRRYDIVHFHALGPAFFSFIPKWTGARIAGTVHGLDWQRDKWGRFASWFLRTGEWMMMRHADFAISVSEDLLPYFREKYGREVDFIPNGVNPPVWRPAKVITETFGLKGNDYILFLARLVPEKGLHYLIDAFSRIRTDWKLVIAGDSSQTNGYVDQVRRQSESVERIVFTGFVGGELLDELYSNTALYVLPSDVEGMPISLMEAMSYGCRCLVSDIPQNTRVTEDLGVSFQAGNVQDLTDKLQKCCDHPEIFPLAEGIRNNVLSRFNWESVVDVMEQRYESICRRK